MEKQFEEIVLQSVDGALDILGSDGKSVVFWLWKSKRNMLKEQIPSHIGEFSKLLNETFGAGTRIIEKHIVGEIERSFDLHDGIASMSTAVQMAKEKFAPDE